MSCQPGRHVAATVSEQNENTAYKSFDETGKFNSCNFGSWAPKSFKFYSSV